jgi:hypothetical protein
MVRVRIEPDVATGLLDFPFLGGSRSDFLSVLARCQLKGNEMQIGSELIIDTSDDWIPPKAAVTTADQSAHFPALFQRNGPPTR